MKVVIISIVLLAIFAITTAAAEETPLAQTGNLTTGVLLPLNTSQFLDKFPVGTGNITIGALLPLSGSLSISGQSDLVALNLAEEDINEFLSKAGKELRVNLVIKDTETDPEITLAALKDLQAQGINIVIGPEDSASLARVRDYADRNGIILISDSSIASSLAVANDTTFRLIPDDIQLGKAIAALMLDDGIRVIIPMERNDVWASGLINATAAAFSAGGGTVMDSIRYSPSTGNFSAELDTLRNELDNALDAHDTESVAIYLLSFEEGALVMSQARAMDNPVLSSVRWYGGDGSAVTFSQNASAAKFAKTTKFVFPRYGNESSETFLRLRERLGMEPDTVSVNAYDALWLITQTYLAVGSNKSEIFRAGLPQVAKTLMGSYGSLALNEAGDRGVTYYEFLTLESINGTMQWRPLARYTSGPGQGENITFFSQ
jgi:branched-chain amino acid transport system substrate-binding protein